MRHGFTLIELMIVIAIIATIAAIAIPNLLESRITSNESAAAASLKAGLFAGQTQFQSGGYSDLDSNGRGEFASDIKYLAGATLAGGTASAGVPNKSLSLIAPNYQAGNFSNIGGAYVFAITTYTTGATTTLGSCTNPETYWGAYAAPNTASDGRRGFGINAGGFVYGTKNSLTTQPTTSNITYGNALSIFATNPGQFNSSNNSSYAVPYQK